MKPSSGFPWYSRSDVEVDLAPVLDERRFPLEQVPEAIRHLEGGRAMGKVVVTV